MAVRPIILCFAALALTLGAFALPENPDAWVEQQVSADPGGHPSSKANGCGPVGKCTSDIFCGAMPKYNIVKKTKGDCIWGTSKTPKNAASSWTPKGSIAEKYVNTGECEYSVYGNPCFWKETVALCDSFKKSDLNCPEYCNKEELYCAARYKNPSYNWEDALGKGKCSKELDERYDAHCDPLHWDFKANKKKIIHCRAHAFSRSCNKYYDAALKQYESKGNPNHEKNCKVALKFHSCDPFSEPFLGKGYCNMQCSTMSEKDGTKDMANSYGNDAGCCDIFAKVLKEKADKDAAEKAEMDKNIKNGSCSDDEAAFKKAWPGYTCQSSANMGLCDYYDEPKKYCKATCKMCGKNLLDMSGFTAEQLMAISSSAKLLAQRKKAQQNPQPTLIEKYLKEGYPDMPLP